MAAAMTTANQTAKIRSLLLAIEGAKQSTQGLLYEQLWSELCKILLDEGCEVASQEASSGALASEIVTDRPPRVLIQCVNENERIGIRNACESFVLEPSKDPYPQGRYTLAESLGLLNNYELLLVQNDAGSNRPTAAQGVITDAIDDFDPYAIIAVGVAFGLTVNLPALNEPPMVVIARETKDYEEAHIGEVLPGLPELGLLIHERGYTGNPDPTLFRNIQVVAHKYDIPFKPGQILCGDKLVDHPGFRASLKKRFPKAIAGEMEGTGLAAACARRRVIRWLLVKGVSDLGDGNKHSVPDDENDPADTDDQRQQLAAETAMTLVLDAIQDGFLSTGSSHL